MHILLKLLNKLVKTSYFFLLISLAYAVIAIVVGILIQAKSESVGLGEIMLYLMISPFLLLVSFALAMRDEKISLKKTGKNSTSKKFFTVIAGILALPLIGAMILVFLMTTIFPLFTSIVLQSAFALHSPFICQHFMWPENNRKLCIARLASRMKDKQICIDYYPENEQSYCLFQIGTKYYGDPTN